jgi:hypothetical protein
MIQRENKVRESGERRRRGNEREMNRAPARERERAHEKVKKNNYRVCMCTPLSCE